ncbi:MULTISPECIES: cellulose biosynthesis protein BcsF [Pseudomonas]|uniref:cellulose biosynthesis protein BcsF n=1 Tax=Pseudomonas TaxID=286 RepID=UPI00159D1909|nr:MULTISPECIES: cellulose biosynthesis protein BcsF [Pseudomonas]MBP2271972.1 cellulose biosynthesis operon protein BcsF/YhjT [Pseudomonas sp. BP6]MBP2289057.1 cellulose biosynthesis operon protein BcsF/YhjT [Pseudomonas sp. BP7]NVN63429.1 cellulose biosynthesis protein BcsF [Pseudomonas putida]NVN69291.1 cellulose biosynthesis protein BcsF [Pseudomonas putida]HDS1695329.1 cellulose biosynthesis protein BcsF [Pseudomonas putida]
MNFVQLLQVVGITALVTLGLALLLVRLSSALRGGLRRRLPPRYLKPLGVRRRAARQEPQND